MEFTRESLLESSRLFTELLEVDDRAFRATFRRLLGTARAWLFQKGDTWDELPQPERTSAYAVLLGQVELESVCCVLGAACCEGKDPVSHSTRVPARIEGDGLPPSGRGNRARSTAVTAGQVFGQWTGLLGQPLPERVTAVELTLILECGGEFLKAALDRIASRFKEEFYRPLVLTSPMFQDVAPEDLSGSERKPGPIRSARFALHPAGSTIVREGEFGNTMFFILRGRTRVGSSDISLGEGEFFGELSAYTFQPRVATVVATEPTLVMECDRLVTNDLKKRIPRLREEIDRSYRERAFLGQVSKFELLQSVEPEALDFLKRTATLEDYEPYQPIFFQGDPADALFLVQNGNVNVTQETDAGPVAIAHLRPGDVFGEGALLNAGDRRQALGAGGKEGPPLLAPIAYRLSPALRGQTVTAVQHVNVVRIPKEAFDEMMAAFPKVAQRLEETLRQRQTENLARGQNSRARAALQWMMDAQLTPGNHVLAIDMASCIRCGNCVTACERTHEDGLSRFFWDRLRGNEELLPHVRVSSSCQHCEDALCMRVCPTVAIERDLTTGGVAIDYAKCIKCGRCADPSQGCPYDSIRIVPTAEVQLSALGARRSVRALANRLTERLTSALAGAERRAPSAESRSEARQGTRYPVKCDLCQGKPFEACVHHCPTGAVFRFDGQQHLSERMQGLQHLGAGRAPDAWPLYFHAAFETAPLLAKKPAVLRLTLTDQPVGMPVTFRRPEPGVKEVVVNVYLTAESLSVGGGQTRQMRLPLTLEPAAGRREEYPVTASTPGPRTLRLSLYQGGFYLKTLPLEAEFV
jgi:CRP-like cAMP-binding protein/Fe-S-cluster-containing dehydrogenase component